MSTMSGATRGVKQNKARETETATNLPQSGTNRTTRGCEQNKARKIERVELSQLQEERLEVLSKQKQERLRRKFVYNEQSDWKR